MTEQQILKKIDNFDENNKIQAIVDFVEGLPVEDRTTAVMSQLGRAYNNLYWQNSVPENEIYLQKAIAVFKYIEDEEAHLASWNYRIGYSYVFLNQFDEAKKYFKKYEELSGEKEEFLKDIELAETKNITIQEALSGGRGGVEYTLESILQYFEKEAPALVEILGDGLNDKQLDAFELLFKVKFTEDFKELHRTFSGQKREDLILGKIQRFVSLEEILEIQLKWLDFVKKYYGERWQEVKLEDSGIVKNQLFSSKWLPIVTGDYMLCVDFDNDLEWANGQVILVRPSENLEEYEIYVLYKSVKEWVEFINNSLKSGYLSYDAEENYLKFNQEENIPEVYSREEEKALENYIDQNFGKFDDVLVYGNDSRKIYIINPTSERNYYTLITGGMGAYEMETPSGTHRFSELVINLPSDWNIDGENPRDSWPIETLKSLTNLPQEQNTYLGWGHTIPMGDFMEGTNFNCLILLGTDTNKTDEEGNILPAIIKMPTGKEVFFYTLVPIYPEETMYKLNHTAEELLEKFEEAKISYPPVVDIHRVNSCEDYVPMEQNYLLDSVKWSFNKNFYASHMEFFGDLVAHNEAIENDLEDFSPFATIFQTPKVKLMYEAFIQDQEYDLLENEILLNPDAEPDENGRIHAQILAELITDDGNSFGASNLLRHIHNQLLNKDLGNNIFFEGFEIQGYEEDGTPAIYLNLKD